MFGVDRVGILAVFFHGDLALAGEAPLAVDHGDLVLLHQELDALGQLVGDVAAAIPQLLEVEGKCSPP